MSQIQEILIGSYGYHPLLNHRDIITSLGKISQDFYRIINNYHIFHKYVTFRGSDNHIHEFLLNTTTTGVYGLSCYSKNFSSLNKIFSLTLDEKCTKSYKNNFHLSCLKDVGINERDFDRLLCSLISKMYFFNHVSTSKYLLSSDRGYTSYVYNI